MATKLVVSVLHFGNEALTLRFIEDFYPKLVQFIAASSGLSCELVLRNNSPYLPSTQIEAAVTALSAEKNKNCSLNFVQSPYNLGFGGGHNANFIAHKSDIFLVLNNDIFFESLDWVLVALAFFEDKKVALVGANNSPATMQESFGFGELKPRAWREPIYAEGSILFVRSKVAQKIGLFDTSYRVAYFEDTDLSLRVRHAGYHIEYLDIPHEHLRSSSSRQVPQRVIQSLIENNRALFFSKWKPMLGRTSFNSKALIDLNACNAAELVLAYPAVLALLDDLKPLGVEVDIWLPNAEFAFLYALAPFKANVLTQGAPHIESYDRVHHCKGLNLQSPFHLQTILAAALGVAEVRGDCAELHAWIASPTEKPAMNITGRYAVLHLESDPALGVGRTIALDKLKLALAYLKEQGMALVLLGEQKGFAESEDERWIAANVAHDLRAKASYAEMLAVLQGSECFVGIEAAPFYLAQLLNKPSFAIFGAINPLLRVLNRANTWAYSDESCACRGCFHQVLFSAESWCARGDQICVTGDLQDTILQLLKAFLSGAAQDWTSHEQILERLRAQWLLVQFHNPVFKNQLLRQSPASASGELANEIQRIVETMENRFEHMLERREAERDAAKREVADLKSMFNDYYLGDAMSFKRDGNAKLYLGAGWHGAEPHGTWTAGVLSSLSLRLANLGNKPLAMQIKTTSFIAVAGASLKVQVNGQYLAELPVAGGVLPQDEIVIPLDLIAPNKMLRINFYIDAANSPKALGLGEDGRVLGMCVAAIKIDEV